MARASLPVRRLGRPTRLALLGLLALTLAAAWTPGAEPAPAPAFTILFTAETHAALLPCDCPLQPVGGVARRATLIARYRARGPVLLVDGGAWAAGGLYDEESDGDAERDRLRTRLMAQALAKMQPDILAIGEEEYSKLGFKTTKEPPSVPDEWRPIFCAMLPALNQRVPLRASEPLGTASWRMARVGETNVGIASLGEPRAVFDAWLMEPLPAWRARHEPGKDVTLQVLVSRLGEDAAAAVAEARPCDLILNAGRKSSARVSWNAGRTTVVNFDYQAQHLGVIDVFPRRGWQHGSPLPRWEIRVRHEPLTPDIPDDPEVAALLAPHLETLRKKGKRTLGIEFWTLPDCPYCRQARPDLAKIAQELAGRATFAPHFLVGKTPEGKFRTLHGEAELAETRVQAVVARHYPERFWEWLAWREKHREAPWEEGARELGLLRARLAGALASGEADALLEADYLLSLRRHVDYTPALIVANKPYTGELERLRFLRVLCGLLDEPLPSVCATVPKCFLDADCRKRGFIGRCLDAGQPQARCDTSRPAVRVPAVVLVEPDALYSNHEEHLEILLHWLPGLEWRLVDPASEEGAALVRALQPERLPAYVLDPLARTEVGYEQNLGEVCLERAGRLLLKGGGVTGPSRILSRPRQRGRADLFAARFSKAGQEAVDAALELLTRPDGAPEIVFHDALFWQETTQPDGQVKVELAARGGLAEVQEAALALAVRAVAPEKFHAYLHERGLRRGGLFWDRAVAAAGLDVTKVRELAEGPDGKGPAEAIVKALEAEADFLKSLQAGGDVVLLAENCEVIPLRSAQELRYYLERIGARR